MARLEREPARPERLRAAAGAKALAAGIERALRAAGSPGRAAQERRYLRSTLEHFGASVPAVRRVAADVRRRHPRLSRAALLRLCDVLWERGVHECRAAAVELLELYGERLAAADLAGAVERYLRAAGTWALVDNLAASVAGPLVERFPELGAVLDRWAADEDFWVRRAALLAELVALREGRGDFDRFGRHADAMLEEGEIFVRKAIGWVLRDASRRNPGRVAQWLLPRAGRASGLTLREATRRLPAAARDEILGAAAAAHARAGSRRPAPAPRRDRGRAPAR
jgi:3-methyladenine DNA glycosylase AlkD